MTKSRLTLRLLSLNHGIKDMLSPGLVVYTCRPALRRLRQEDPEFKTNTGYTARPCLKMGKTNRP